MYLTKQGHIHSWDIYYMHVIIYREIYNLKNFLAFSIFHLDMCMDMSGTSI